MVVADTVSRSRRDKLQAPSSYLPGKYVEDQERFVINHSPRDMVNWSVGLLVSPVRLDQAKERSKLCKVIHSVLPRRPPDTKHIVP